MPSATTGAFIIKPATLPPKKPRKRRYKVYNKLSKVLGTQYSNLIMMLVFKNKEINSIIHFPYFFVSYIFQGTFVIYSITRFID